MARFDKNWLLPVLLIGILALSASAVLYSYGGKSNLVLDHVEGGVYSPPKYLGTIDLPRGSQPAWAYFAEDKLYVDYFKKPNIDIFSPEGNKVGTFTTTVNTAEGAPQGMAMVDKKLLVTDFRNRMLTFFSPEGNYLESFNKRPDQKEIIPVGAAVYNRVFYITDVSSKGWMAIGDDGELINVVAGKDEKTTLQFPYGIWVTGDGRVFVTDPRGGKIKVFVCAGWYAFDLPTSEVGLKNPQGITMDGLGRFHIVDNGTNQIFVYDNRGFFLFKYGTGLKNPANITVDGKRRLLYITNTGDDNISLWGY